MGTPRSASPARAGSGRVRAATVTTLAASCSLTNTPTPTPASSAAPNEASATVGSSTWTSSMSGTIWRHSALRIGDALIKGAHEVPGAVVEAGADEIGAQQRIPVRAALAVQIGVEEQPFGAGRNRCRLPVHRVKDRAAIVTGAAKEGVAQPFVRRGAGIGR